MDCQKERDLQEDQDVGVWIILSGILERSDGVMWTIGLAQDRGKWRALVNSVMNLRIPQNVDSCELAS
jgi:hypothetical protein